MPDTRTVLLTCEHGGNRVPRRYQSLFRGCGRLLHSHRGYDVGSLPVARRLARLLEAPLFHATVSRLVVDLNRSPGHPNLFSSVTKQLTPLEKRYLLENYYYPHRRAVEAWIREQTRRGVIVYHVAIHTFVPRLNAEVRTADVGLLYDAKRPLESDFCRETSQLLKAANSALRVRRNYPYRGTADGLTTYLRRRFSAQCYVGVELEINQRMLGGNSSHLVSSVVRTMATALNTPSHANDVRPQGRGTARRSN